jgi:hypothetical protein
MITLKSRHEPNRKKNDDDDWIRKSVCFRHSRKELNLMIIACIYLSTHFLVQVEWVKGDFHMNKMFEHAQLRTTNAHVIDNCRILIIKFYTWKTLCRLLLLIKLNYSFTFSLSLSYSFEYLHAELITIIECCFACLLIKYYYYVVLLDYTHQFKSASFAVVTLHWSKYNQYLSLILIGNCAISKERKRNTL